MFSYTKVYSCELFSSYSSLMVIKFLTIQAAMCCRWYCNAVWTMGWKCIHTWLHSPTQPHTSIWNCSFSFRRKTIRLTFSLFIKKIATYVLTVRCSSDVYVKHSKIIHTSSNATKIWIKTTFANVNFTHNEHVLLTYCTLKECIWALNTIQEEYWWLKQQVYKTLMLQPIQSTC